ncbi:MAG: hypothetical protein QME79_14415 [Bacillota bacterium]|nr:hypothetical protein [Bacillota bacterium]
MIRIKGKIGDLKTKDGIVFDFKGEVSPSDDELIALRHLQQAPEVVFTIEPAVEQQSLPLDKPAAVVDVPGQVKLHIENVRCRRGGPEADLCGQCPTPPNECELFMAAPRTCPGCGTSMDKVAGGWRCPKCGLGVTVDGEVNSWITHNSASDVNYAATIPELSDAELLYCLAQETRASGRVQLKREIRRRLRQQASGPDPYPEWTARLRAALNEESGPEEATSDDRPFRPAAGE